ADAAVDRAAQWVYGSKNPKAPKVLLTTYFGAVDHRKALIDALAVDGLHVDLVRGPGQLSGWLIPSGRVLSLGLVDGRNIWKTRPEQLAARLAGFDGREAWIGS